MKKRKELNILKNKQTIFLILILIFASFLRFYKIDNCHFEKDQVDETLVAKDIVYKGIIPVLGEKCGSCSNEVHFLGPFYYYLLIIPNILFNFHPCGGAFLTALLGVFSVFLCYKLGEIMFNQNIGLLSAFFISFTPFVVHCSRHQWSINILPFFVFLCLYSLFKIKNKEHKYWYLFSFSFGILLQLHFSNFFFIPAIFLFLLIFKPKINKKSMLTSFVIIPILFIPTIISEITSNFKNLNAVLRFFFNSSGNIGFNFKMFEDFFISQHFWGINSIIISIIISVLYFSYSLYLIKKKIFYKEIIFLVLWILITVLVLISNVNLKGIAFNFEVIFPAIFILMGLSFNEIFKIKNKIIVLIIIVLIASNFIHSMYVLNHDITYIGGGVQNKILAVNFIIKNSTTETPKIKIYRFYIDNWDEKPFLYLFDYYGKNISLVNESFDYIIIDPNDNETLLDNYLNITKFRIDFGEISVIKKK